MKKIMLLLLVSCALFFAEASDMETLEGAWFQADVKWTNAPPDINPHLQSTQAEILYFQKDRGFAVLYCTVGREGKKYMTISNGDPRGVYKGNWTGDERTLSVTYRLVEATILRKGQTLPGPIQHGTIKTSRGFLAFEGKSFRRAIGSIAERSPARPQSNCTCAYDALTCMYDGAIQ